ncbi:MAG: 3-phosphoshikimate 1-carboxyvinyltransferase, partial [Planctomycetota bacterium]
KSCVLLAGLRAEGKTVVHEPARSRDHTERMLGSMGVEVEVTETSVALRGGQALQPKAFKVPGDFSSAAFPIAAALLVPGSEVEIEDVGLNPTRTGLLEALDAMGADVQVTLDDSFFGREPSGRILARGTRQLTAIHASGELVVRAIDELPALFALAAFAKGRSTFRDAQELRKKESDRIGAMARGLRALGVVCEELSDGIAIEGDPDRVLVASGPLDGSNDHRIVMALACAALRAGGAVKIDGSSAITKSYPGFFADLERLGGRK